MKKAEATVDAGRFDALSKSLARRRSRRSLGAGGLGAGLLAALGVKPAAAAPAACVLAISAKTAAGPHKGTKYAGTLKMTIDDKGAIDTGSFDTTDGKSFPLVGQAAGRAINLRIKLGGSDVLALHGTADIDLILCRGDASGTFGGPSDTDIGDWRTVDATAGSASSANGGGSTSGGGGGNTSGGGGSDTSGCASGVVCGGVCCASIASLTPDGGIACNPNDNVCECTYSCGAAGCPEGGTQGAIVVTCGSDPQPQCHNSCNFPTDNGCGNQACPDGQTLDPDSCTCVASTGCPDASFPTPCGAGAQTVCVDLTSDPKHCGTCGNDCLPGQPCVNGACACVPDGGLCDSGFAAQCCGNICGPSGVCGCVDAGAACNATGDCCDQGDGGCVNGFCAYVNGHACAGDSACISGFCLNGVCRDRQSNGSACASDSACITNFCQNGVCADRPS